jgi:hypothetical protein
MSDTDDSATTTAQLRSEMDYDDWVDIADSEFVDVVKSGIVGNFGLVFEHDEIGLHGFMFRSGSQTLEPVVFSKGESDD